MIFQEDTRKRWRMVKVIFYLCVGLLALLFVAWLLQSYGGMAIPGLTVFIMSLYGFVKGAFVTYLLLAIIIGFLRMVLLLIFSLRHKRRKERLNSGYRPTVSVILAMYNEEIVMRRTIRALLKSAYPVAEIVIIDDGSTDRTAAIGANLARLFSKVTLVKRPNGGKAAALNLGVKSARGDIVVMLDADTIFTKHTISHLVAAFRDPRVAAVSGNCKVGNRVNQLTIWQHIEYVTANQLEKRAFAELNCMTVVPGSNSAWRKSVVEQLGYYKSDTLAEDAELTMRLLNAGYYVVYENRATSYEECPETVRDFMKQRSRWSYGILQVAWKHKRHIARSSNKALKYFAVPSLLFTYTLLLTAPLIDIIFIIALLSGTTSVYFFALLFYATDFLQSFIAFRLGKEKLRPLVWLILQRFGYRYLLSYATWLALLSALKGEQVGWKKVARSGNAVYKR